MNNTNQEYCVLYLTFIGFNYKLSNIKTYILLNSLSKKLKLFLSKKTISYGKSNIMYWQIGVDLNDNIDNYGKLETVYNILVEDCLKNNYSPKIYIVTEDYSLNLEDIPKEDYNKESTKKLFLRKPNNLCKSLKRNGI